MSPDDPRHGTRAGYQAHRKAGQNPCGPCLRGRAREDKLLSYDRHRGVRIDYTAAEVYAVLEPWLALGCSGGAIAAAAGLGVTHGSRLMERVTEGRPFRRVTYLAIAHLTEADLSPTTTVYADLTKTRVYSLMAAGHPLTAMPIPSTGRWRDYPTVTVAQARRVRDYYTEHQDTTGPSEFTRSRALRNGHMPPAAWDDPGTLAWPLGWHSPIGVCDAVDEVAVQRILSGDWRAPANHAERVEVVHRWRTTGRSLSELARLTGWKPERYYTRTPNQDQEVA